MQDLSKHQSYASLRVHHWRCSIQQTLICTTMDSYRTIAAGKLFDPIKQEILENQLITVNVRTGIISNVSPAPNGVFNLDWKDPDIIDLRGLTVLPGFVDVHVHSQFNISQTQGHERLRSLVFLHPYSETSWENQVTRESIVERTVRATLHAKKTLLAGFTTVRFVTFSYYLRLKSLSHEVIWGLKGLKTPISIFVNVSRALMP
jgi:imidazolonepropionase-like amidohydrolase